MNNRNRALDWLKLVMAMAVVGIHTEPFIDAYAPLYYVLTQGIFRLAVPVFLMATGFYFSRMMENPGEMRSWVRRLLLLYAIWMVVYGMKYLPRNTHPATFLQFGLTLLLGYWHLWYLVAACLGGAMLYALRSRSDESLASVAAVLFFGGVCMQYLVAWFDLKNPVASPAFDHQVLCRNFLFLGFPFLTAGYLISRNTWIARARISTVAGWLLVGLFSMCFESLENYGRYGIRQPFETLVSLPLPAVSLFALMQKICIARGPGFIGPLSTAIYLSHPLAILLLLRIGVQHGAMQFLYTLILTVAISPVLLCLARAFPELLGNRSVTSRRWQPS